MQPENTVPRNLKIRKGTVEDASALAVLATQVWLHTYATHGITTDIAEYVLRDITPQKYRSLLGDTACQVIVAVDGESLIGLAVVQSGVPCPTEHAASVELQTLYVQAHFLGCGVGSLLLRAAEAEAQRRTNGVLWLTVNAENATAIAFYARKGYTRIGTTYFVLGEGRHENHVLVGV